MCMRGASDRLQSYDAIVSIMVRDELNFHAAESGEGWVKAAARLFMQTHVLVAGLMGQSVVPDAVQLFCAKCMAINFFYVPNLARFIVRAVTRSTPIESRASETVGARISAAHTKLLDALARNVPHEKQVRGRRRGAVSPVYRRSSRGSTTSAASRSAARRTSTSSRWPRSARRILCSTH